MLTFLRMLFSGIALLIITRLMGEKFDFTFKDLKNYTIIAFFLIVMGGGFVSKGQETVASGTTAMLIGIVPSLMLLSDWFFSKIRPSIMQVIGIVVGFAAISYMQYYQGLNGETSIVGFVLILASTLGWVYGSHLTTKLSSPTRISILRSTGYMMIIGGLETLVFALLVGERLSAIEYNPSFIFYLTLQTLTTLVGYASYFWLLQKTRPMIAISYEFVNPVVALFLGWLIGGEVVQLPLIIACFFLVSSVFFAVSNKHS